MEEQSLSFFKKPKKIQRNNFGDIRIGCFCPERKVYLFRKNKIEKSKKKKRKKKEKKN